MGNFDDFDVEIQDNKERNSEHHNGTVTTAGTPETETTDSGDAIQLTYIYNPSRGPLANSPGDLLYVSWDGGTSYTTITRGSWFIWPGKGSGAAGDTLTIDSNVDGVNYECILVTSC